MIGVQMGVYGVNVAGARWQQYKQWVMWHSDLTRSDRRPSYVLLKRKTLSYFNCFALKYDFPGNSNKYLICLYKAKVSFRNLPPWNLTVSMVVSVFITFLWSFEDKNFLKKTQINKPGVNPVVELSVFLSGRALADGIVAERMSITTVLRLGTARRIVAKKRQNKQRSKIKFAS